MSIQSGDSLADHYERFLERLDDVIYDYLNVVPEDHDPVHNMSGLHAWRAKVRKGMRDRRKTGSVTSSDSIQSDLMHVQQEPSAETTSNQAASAVYPPRVTQQDAPQGSGETCSSSSRENSVDIMMNELDRSIRKEEELGHCLLGDVFDDFGDGYGAEPMNVADAMHLAANNLAREGHSAKEAHFEEAHSSQHVDIEAAQQEAEWDSSRIELQQAIFEHGGIDALEELVETFDFDTEVKSEQELRGLVEWSKKQRRSYKRQELSRDQVDKLQELCDQDMWSWEAKPKGHRGQKKKAPRQHTQQDEEDNARVEEMLRLQKSDPPSRARAASPISAAERKKLERQRVVEQKAKKKAGEALRPLYNSKAGNEQWNRCYNLVLKHGDPNTVGRIWDLPDDFEVNVRGEMIQLGAWLSVQKMEIVNYEKESPNWYNKLVKLFGHGWDMSRRDSPAVTLNVPKSEPLSDDESDMEGSLQSVSVAPSASSNAASASSVSSALPTAAAAVRRPSTPDSVISTGTAASLGTSVTGRTAGTSRTLQTGSTNATEATIKVTKIPPKHAAAPVRVAAATRSPVDHALLSMNQLDQNQSQNQNQHQHQNQNQHRGQSKSQGQIFAAVLAAEAEMGAGTKRKQPSPEPQTNHKVSRTEVNLSPHKIKTEPLAASIKEASSRMTAIDLSQSASDSDTGSSSGTSSSSSQYTSSTSSSVRSVDSQDPAVVNAFSLKNKGLFKQAAGSSASLTSAFAAPVPRPKEAVKTKRPASRPTDTDMEEILPPRIPDVLDEVAPPRVSSTTDMSRDPRLKSAARAHNHSHHTQHTTLPVPSPVKHKSHGESSRGPSPPSTSIKIKLSPSAAAARPASQSSRPGSTTAHAAEPAVSVKVSPAPSPAPAPTLPPPRLKGPLIAEGNYVAVVYAPVNELQNDTGDDGMDGYKFALAKEVDDPPGSHPGVMHVLRLVPEHPSDLFNSRFKYKHNAAKIVPAEADKLLIANLKFLVDVPGGEYPLRLTDGSKNDLAILCESIDVRQICYESD